MLCSILIPSRRRFERLKKCIQSFQDLAHNKTCFEFLVRFHNDDAESISRISELSPFGNVRVVVSHKTGYSDVHHSYTELALLSKSRWLWLMNDDCVIEGDNWDKALNSHNHRKRSVVQPEFHKLGGSTYPKDTYCPFMVLPNHRWMVGGIRGFGAPADTATLDWLINKHSWTVDFLTGVTIWHQRATQGDIDAERARD